jgi:hypothetical protein
MSEDFLITDRGYKFPRREYPRQQSDRSKPSQAK